MKQLSITLTNEIYEAIMTHAKEALPNESCGYLGGNNNQVTTFYPMKNMDESPEHFSFDPKEQFSVVKKAREKKESLISVYHSHPNTPARLSEEYLRLFNDSNIVYIIVSLENNAPMMNAFKVNKPSDDEIEIYKVNIEIKKGE